MNAIDIVMRGLWVEHENAKNAESLPSKKSPPAEEERSPVVVVA